MRGLGQSVAEKVKWDTSWYDTCVILYQRTKITEFRNILWKQVERLMFSRIKKFVANRKGTALRNNPELIHKLYNEAFFIFLKACDRWNPEGITDAAGKLHRTTFVTFLGDIIEQEIMNVVSLDWYYKNRDIKIARRLISERPFEQTPDQELFEKNDLLADIKGFLENYTFENELERDVVWTMIYGIPGDWAKLQKKFKLSISAFSKVRKKTVTKLRDSVLLHCSPKQKDVLRELLEEK